MGAARAQVTRAATQSRGNMTFDYRPTRAPSAGEVDLLSCALAC
jgi:hypothetical protein